MIQTSTCRACGAAADAARHDAPDTMYGTGESFPYGECVECRSLTLLEAPDDFAPYYRSDYLSMTADPAELDAAARLAVTALARAIVRERGRVGEAVGAAAGVVPVRRVRTLTTILRSVARVPGSRPRRVLDVGSGSGMVPFAVSLAGGVEVLGIDPFAAGDRQLGDAAELRATTLDAVTGEFDLVMLHHSLEHMLEPVAALADARRLLAPAGVVLVRVPTVSSFAWREYGSDWIQLDPPRHVWLPSRRGLAAAARAAGLEVVATYDDAGDFQFWGSEQARRGVALTDPSSHFVDPKRSQFSSRELRSFRRRSRELNRVSDGDQTVVYLRAAGTGG